MRRPLWKTLILLLFSAGCASTNMTSMIAPEAKGRFYQRILVLALVADLGERQQLEDSFTNAPHDAELVCDPLCRDPVSSTYVAGYTLFFPGRTFTTEEQREILVKNKIDATLVLAPTSSGIEQVTLPQAYFSSCSASGSSASCSTSQTGGGTLSRPWANYAAKLYDVQEAKAVWVSTSKSGGTVFSSFEDVLQSMASTTREHLKRDGLVR